MTKENKSSESADRKKFQKQRAAQTAKVHSQQLRKEANKAGQKGLTTHIWQECLDLVEQQRIERGKQIYEMGQA